MNGKIEERFQCWQIILKKTGLYSFLVMIPTKKERLQCGEVRVPGRELVVMLTGTFDTSSGVPKSVW